MSRMTHEELVAMLAAQQEQTAAIVAHLQAATSDAAAKPTKKPKARARKTATPAASKAVDAAVPVPAEVQPAPKAESVKRPRKGKAAKAEKVPYDVQDFTGGGVTLRVAKYHGKRWHPETNPNANYVVVTSPDDPTLKIYLNYKTARIVCVLCRSAAAQAMINFVADC